MIETIAVSKKYDDLLAVDGVSLQIKENQVFGLIGTNGAGKSTYMRMISGIMKPDKGEVRVDDVLVFENPKIKRRVCFLSDEQYFFTNATAVDMEKYYNMMYPLFDKERFYRLLDQFGLNKKAKIHTYSKGMKKQLQLLLGICARTKYLLCDETFDGLDPVMRQAVKSIMAGEIASRELTPVIASHNLRELEDICDSVGLLYKGGVILNKNLEDIRSDIHKIQCVFSNEEDEKRVLDKLNIMKDVKRGSLHLLTVRGELHLIENILAAGNPVFSEVLPLTLEEIFISETEVIGYDIKKLIG